MNKIAISVNNDIIELPETCSLSHLLDMRYPTQDSKPNFAVAKNGEFVPRSKYDAVTLRDGDELDIVSPIGGG